MMLRSQSQPVSSKASPKTSTSSQMSPTIRAHTSVNKSIDVTELANTLLPLLSQTIQESVAPSEMQNSKKLTTVLLKTLVKLTKSSPLSAQHTRELKQS